MAALRHSASAKDKDGEKSEEAGKRLRAPGEAGNIDLRD